MQIQRSGLDVIRLHDMWIARAHNEPSQAASPIFEASLGRRTATP